MHRHTLVRAMRAAGLAALASTTIAPAASAAPTAHLLKKLVDSTQDGVSNAPAPFTSAGNTYFIANDGYHGEEPWVSGPSGGFPLADINPGHDGSQPSNFAAAGDTTYFQANNGQNRFLYETHGTAESTQAVAGAPTNAGNVTAYGGDVYLSGGDYSLLYRRAAGTATFERVTLPNATDTQYIEALNVVADRLVISTFEFSNLADPHRLITRTATGDHTLQWAGSDLSLDVNQGVQRSGDRLFFKGNTADGPRLFVSDGTDAGTHIITLPGGGPASLVQYERFIVAEPGHMIFRQGGTWYDTDGTTTTAVGAAPGTAFGTPEYAGGALYYVVNQGGPQWTYVNHLSSPTSAGEVFRATVSRQFTESDGVVYFVGQTVQFTSQNAIFRTDGTPSGTVRVTETEFTEPSAISTIYPKAGGGLLFSGTSSTYGRELFSSNGTPGAAATLLVDANARPEDSDIESNPDTRVVLAGKTLFTAYLNRQSQLWTTDGTTAGTNPLNPDLVLGDISSVTAFGDKALFLARPGEDETQLWVTDGTAAGTHRVSTLEAGAAGVNVESIQVVGSSVYYLARDTNSGPAGLFKSDGNAPGTPVAAPDTGWTASTTPRGLKVVGTDLYFAADDYEQSGEDAYRGIWKHNTVTGVTSQVTASTAYFYMDEAVVADGKLYVGAQPYGVDEWQVWVSDGTSDGTHDLGVEPGARPNNSSQPRLTTNGTAVLANVAQVDGANIYSRRLSRIVGTTVDRPTLPTDVTADSFYGPATLGDGFYVSSGNKLVKLGATGPGSIVRTFTDEIDSPKTVGDKLYFAGSDAEHGAELWSSDGTTDGTVFLADVAPGTESAWPWTPFQAGDRIAFMAYTEATGSQLFAYGEPQASAATPTPTPTLTPTPTPAPTGTPAPKAADPAATPAPTPAATPTPDTRPVPDKVKTGVDEVIETKKSYVFDVSGSVLPPKGLRTRAMCKGRVTIVITATTKKGKGKTAKTTTKEIATIKTKLKWKGGKCTFDKTVTIAKKLVPAGAKLEATVIYGGSATQQPKTGEPIEIELD